MSTKKIHEALDMLGAVLPTQTSPEVAQRVLRDARSQLGAVEDVLREVAGKLELALQQKSNPGSTNGTLGQSAARLRALLPPKPAPRS